MNKNPPLDQTSTIDRAVAATQLIARRSIRNSKITYDVVAGESLKTEHGHENVVIRLKKRSNRCNRFHCNVKRRTLYVSKSRQNPQQPLSRHREPVSQTLISNGETL